MNKVWEYYEKVGTFLLNKMAREFGLKYVESKQEIVGKISCEKWEIDAKGIRENKKAFIIIEFRRYTTRRISKKDTGGFAYTIRDLGGEGGILVSPLGLQKGAKKIAKSANIIEVKMDENSTTLDYILRFLDKIKVGRHGKLNFKGSLKARIIKNNGTVEDLGELKNNNCLLS
jgi:hypothetical protein